MPSESSFLSQRIERVQQAIQQFPAAALSLNIATDQLGKSVAELDVVLKKFSLGVPTWVSFSGWERYNHYGSEEVGYAKIGGRWGIAIRTVHGNDQDPDDDIEQWLFNDAPRMLRVRAVEKIPDLLEELLKTAAVMAVTITEKSKEVDAITAGINSVIGPPAEPKAGKP